MAFRIAFLFVLLSSDLFAEPSVESISSDAAEVEDSFMQVYKELVTQLPAVETDEPGNWHLSKGAEEHFIPLYESIIAHGNDCAEELGIVNGVVRDTSACDAFFEERESLMSELLKQGGTNQHLENDTFRKYQSKLSEVGAIIASDGVSTARQPKRVAEPASQRKVQTTQECSAEELSQASRAKKYSDYPECWRMANDNTDSRCRSIVGKLRELGNHPNFVSSAAVRRQWANQMDKADKYGCKT